MNASRVTRICWSASATLALLLAVAPAIAAQTGPTGPAGVEKIDLNTASQAALESLPGVDMTTAQQIIAGRPYGSVADLSKTGMPTATIERITPLVKVGPLGKAAAATTKGAQKGAAGVGKGADATANGIDKGVGAAAKGVQKGAAATASAAGTVDRKLTGAPRVPPQAGMVWVNTATKVYHKAGDPSYGTTKKGKWLTEEEAVKQGYRPAKVNAAKEQ
jgi:Helix-hairpin-helix motif